MSEKERLVTHINMGKATRSYAERSEGLDEEEKVPKISNMGKVNYTKHFEGASLVNRHDFHNHIGKLSAPVVEKMLQKMLLAVCTCCTRNRISDKIRKSHKARNARIRETKPLAKLGRPWRNNTLEH